MESEGPYKVVNKEDEIYSFSVIGPGVDWPDRADEGTAKRICEIANNAYAEGRKSMEKDFKELLELANQLNSGYKYDYSELNDMPVVSHKFEGWKKARGIE